MRKTRDGYMEGRKEKAGWRREGQRGSLRGGRAGAIEEETVRWVGISTGWLERRKTWVCQNWIGKARVSLRAGHQENWSAQRMICQPGLTIYIQVLLTIKKSSSKCSARLQKSVALLLKTSVTLLLLWHACHNRVCDKGNWTNFRKFWDQVQWGF